MKAAGLRYLKRICWRKIAISPTTPICRRAGNVVGEIACFRQLTFCANLPLLAITLIVADFGEQTAQTGENA